MIKAEKITKKYGNLQVLDQIDMEVSKASVVSIVGRSGAGKSTLLHILGTLDLPDTGSLYIDGMEVTKMSEKKLAQFRNEHMGFVFQFHHLLDEFSALENVMMPALIKGDSRKEAEARASELLTYLGLEDRKEHRPAALSGGEQQRVAVARALVNKPSIIFADEPTGNLDLINATDMHNLFIRLKNDFQQTFVIVTHNTELAQMSDELYKMEDGKLIRQ
ncbi:MAG: ABC transporter ATP-binding protein [Saprospiraceae bacterium]|nr:ABC transporter ATP-binding protein [Saprospiraceae bacterium]MBK7223766.1 ABC transporter ATP-binding protein [Saprospiraceae bacterium]MBK7787910.1 ABC transporter ATP-binding protein [Saprospiraceae bacterium]MBK8849918.1 ABC transporter ATP-binding protein [Saprospiraceae bacterium]MBL0081712.1 ABC transporter ATP-binding protein [Saprospiraceae bacterium]